MPHKTEQLQVRVTPSEKAAIRRRAEQAGLDVSAYVIRCALPPSVIRWRELLEELRQGGQQPRLALAALHDFVSGLPATELPAAVADADLDGLSSLLQNYVAAVVEHTAYLLKVAPPAWAREVEPLDEPQFEPPSASLRLHLLRVAPVAFKRRNLFVDLTSGDPVQRPRDQRDLRP